MDESHFPSGQLHQPVLYQSIIQAIRPHTTGKYVDATVGAGGHAWGILNESSPNGLLLGLDIDPKALEIAAFQLKAFGRRLKLIHSSYTRLEKALIEIGWHQVDGIIIDLGVSSMQIDNPERGFSFQVDGPLDMRFDPANKLTAADLINQMSEDDLATIIWKYGEDHLARKISRAICRERPFETTLRLAKVIQSVSGQHHWKIHPATKTFQALRLVVNGELEAVEQFLPQAITALKPEGRLAVISFHSLEDRIVKQFFSRESRDCICPTSHLFCTCGHKASIRIINRKPVTAENDEVSINPRSRSAKLRIVEKLDLA